MPPKRNRPLSQEPDSVRSAKRAKPPDDGGTDLPDPQVDADDAKSDASGHSAASLAKHNRVTPKSTEPVGPVGDVEQLKNDAKSEQGKDKDTQDFGYDDETNIRIAKIRSYVKGDTVYIGKASGHFQWTKVDEPGKDNYYALAQQGSRNPVKLWFIGNITKTYFYDINGEAPSSVSLTVTTLDKREGTLANNLLIKHSVPATSDNTYTDVRFSKWTAQRRPGEEKMTAEFFGELYDARNGFSLPRSKMPHIAPKVLKKGDLVFVEASVARWHPRKEGKSKKAIYSEYNAYYAINYIALLDDGPAPGIQATVTGEDDEVEF